MADNLKVNAKSKILTFKKKHNLLVESFNNLDNNTIKKYDITNYGINEIPSELISKIKLGDMLIDDGTLYLVEYADPAEFVVVGLDNLENGIYNFVIYSYNNDEWEFVSSETRSIDGTKLYKHEIIFNTQGGDLTVEFTSNHSKQFNLISEDDRILFVSNIRLMGGYIEDDVEGTNGRILEINSTASSVVGTMFSSADVEVTQFTFSLQDFGSDTVTEL